MAQLKILKLGGMCQYLKINVANIMTKSSDFLSENRASRGAKTDFLSFVIRELLTFECVVSNRSPLGHLPKKFAWSE